MLKIYYWSSNINKNSGEGILALNFLSLLKKKYKKCSFIKLNTFNHKENFFYNYIVPFFGILKIWKHHIKGEKVCYINYLPIWNFLIFIMLPKKTILGPITGSNLNLNIIYRILKHIGIFFIKKNNKILLSHNQFKKYFKNRRNVYYNFILYNFNLKKKIKTNIKKFDFVIYFKKHSNKGNDFLINIILRLSKKFQVVVIGDEFPKSLGNDNIYNYINVNRERALKLISLSKNSIISKENSLSFYALDCVSCNLNIFYNVNDKISNSIKTNLFTPIKFNDLDHSFKVINKEIASKKNKRYFKFKLDNFLNYLDI